MKLGPYRRMDAIRTNQEIAMPGWQCRARRADEAGRHLLVILLEVDQPMPEADPVVTEPFPHGPKK